MSWIVVIALVLAAFACSALVFKAPRGAWEPIGAALMLGVAGFALQASPWQAGAPKEPAQQAKTSGAALVEARQQLGAQGDNAPNSWMIIADAMSRNGQYGDAAGIVLGAVEKNPRNADAWLALANNLVAHADGTLSPASRYAYARAAEADPLHPGPAFFLGLALATNGKPEEGRAMWAQLLARAPADAPWRADLQMRLGRLDAFIAEQTGARQAEPPVVAP